MTNPTPEDLSKAFNPTKNDNNKDNKDNKDIERVSLIANILVKLGYGQIVNESLQDKIKLRKYTEKFLFIANRWLIFIAVVIFLNGLSSDRLSLD